MILFGAKVEEEEGSLATTMMLLLLMMMTDLPRGTKRRREGGTEGMKIVSHDHHMADWARAGEEGSERGRVCTDHRVRAQRLE